MCFTAFKADMGFQATGLVFCPSSLWFGTQKVQYSHIDFCQKVCVTQWLNCNSGWSSNHSGRFVAGCIVNVKGHCPHELTYPSYQHIMHNHTYVPFSDDPAWD